MLVAAAVCPHPPLIVPVLAAGAAGELDELRSNCDRAVGVLAAHRPDLVVVVGDAPAVGPFPAGAWGSLTPYGVDHAVGAVGTPTAGLPIPTLPLSLLVGRWLLERVSADVPTLLFGVSGDTDVVRCALLGSALAHRAARVALLVMGDGSARRSRKGPGYLDERAQAYDDGVAAALATGDLDALGRLDPQLSGELLVAGRAAWQVLGGAAAGRPWSGDLLYAASPYGVTYLVATLTPADQAAAC